MKKHLSKLLSVLLLCLFLFCLTLKVSAQKPTITTISPLRGKVGTLVTITGTNFSTNPAMNVVFFGAAMAQVDHVISANQLVVVAPVGADNQLISVTNLATRLTANTSFAFHLTYTNLGQISFDVANQKEIISSAASPQRVKIVFPKDLDGDGDIDLIVAIRDADEIRVYTNTSSVGQVSFAAPITLTTPLPDFITVADLTGDGLMDIASVDSSTGDIHVFLNASASLNAPIAFEDKITLNNGAGEFCASLEATDIDGDGKLDLVKMNWHTAAKPVNTVSVYRNTSINGNLAFDVAESFDVGPTASGFFYMAIGDFLGNLDGKPDLVINMSGSQDYNFLKNTSTPGQIGFVHTSSLTSTTNNTIKVADLNNDNLPDLIFRNNNDKVIVKLNLGGDNFAAEDIYSGGSAVDNLSFSDFDGDGYPDILVALTTGGADKFAVLKNNNTIPGKFFPAVLFDIPLAGRYHTAVDIDGDGKQDVTTLDIATNSRLTVALNNQTAPAEVETLSATNTTTTNTTFYGNIKAITADVDVSFEYGTDPDLTTFTSVDATSNKHVLVNNEKYAGYDLIGNFSADLYYRVVATDGFNNEYKGEIVKIIIPATVVGITTNSTNPNNGSTGTVYYKVEFSKPVTGFTAANFTLAQTGGITNATISNVLQNPINANLWQVAVSLGPIAGNGTVQVSLANATNIATPISNVLPFAGEIVAVDNIVVPVELETLPGDILTKTSVAFYGNVETYATNVSVGFEYGTDPNLSSFIWVGATNNQQVAANSTKTASYVLTSNFNADLYYRVVAQDGSGNQFRGKIVRAQVFSASVVGITTITPNPNTGSTDNGTVVYSVEFSKPVTGVTAANFAVTQTGGVTNATISNVQQNPIVANLWQVTVDLGSVNNDGTVQLFLANATNLSAPITTTLPFDGEIVAVNLNIVGTTLLATNIVAGGATLNGSVQAKIDGVLADLLYSTQPNLANGKGALIPVASIAKDAGFVNFSADLINQTPGKYYYAVVASDNLTTTIVGNILSVDIPTSITAIQLLVASPMPSPGNALYRVEFPITLTGLTAANFNVQTTGGVGGVTILSVVVDANDPNSWIVTLDVPAGYDGSLTLNLINDTGLQYKLAGLPFASATLTIDGTPLAPQNLSVNEGDALVKLAWQPVADNNLSGYKVYAGTMPNPTTFIANVAASALAYTNINLTNGTTYYYRITARDASGNESDYSNEVSATPQVGSVPITDQTIAFAALGNKTYGDADFDAGAMASSGFAVTYTSSDNNIATIVNGKVHILHAGTVTIYANQSGNGTYAAATQTSQTLTINQLTINVTANTQNKAYGAADPALTYTHTPVLIGADVFTASLSRTAGEVPGSYSITQGTLALSNDYIVKFNSAGFVINLIPLTLTADAKAKVYGDIDPIFTYSITSGSLIPGDALSGTLSRAVGENVGMYAISQGSLTAGLKYTITLAGANLVVSPAPITITANAMTKEVGDVDPVLTYIYSPALLGTDVFTGNLDRVVGESVGTYAIGQGSLTAGNNYIVSFVPAALSVMLKSADEFKLVANNILTPNGDGINDKLVIQGLDQYPTAKLTIVDREGRVVFVSENYQNNFDGTYNGKPLSNNTYYYIIDFGKELGKIKSFITIVNE
ncbi:T9SS type B sorting domain-containing protein [Pedobacter sp. LMG 31464]|uniref:T9SS type B sorting domain-containing protein n=1 Tax=Pedobacter planticolens TaxID=2679964 RepID=A0A923DY85_9SPHI|nr:MBG domain-containing protein [Pedobacter planticolens]MBB2145285.1 T9SS type B sorting domain-containing protein [Pedobacter planticolens]